MGLRVQLDGRSLTVAGVAAIAAGRSGAEVPADGVERARAAAELADTEADRRPIYGRSTGVGANREIAVSDPSDHVMRLLRSHATGAGPARSAERVRATLAVRVNQLAAGGSCPQ